ncbi:hypothetical protein C8F04DRAFT_1197214 [Mycena alexandri]|uniref:Uncharacterized protein n=1 Tax=Mycena alexandri TaxID=1745969 RepID=A0AAD6S332_9AGAR|nr:hypothetical protein C8F04DRAFT_1197214 [Mycena alexandri]
MVGMNSGSLNFLELGLLGRGSLLFLGSTRCIFSGVSHGNAMELVMNRNRQKKTRVGNPKEQAKGTLVDFHVERIAGLTELIREANASQGRLKAHGEVENRIWCGRARLGANERAVVDQVTALAKRCLGVTVVTLVILGRKRLHDLQVPQGKLYYGYTSKATQIQNENKMAGGICEFIFFEEKQGAKNHFIPLGSKRFPVQSFTKREVRIGSVKSSATRHLDRGTGLMTSGIAHHHTNIGHHVGHARRGDAARDGASGDPRSPIYPRFIGYFFCDFWTAGSGGAPTSAIMSGARGGAGRRVMALRVIRGHPFTPDLLEARRRWPSHRAREAGRGGAWWRFGWSGSPIYTGFIGYFFVDFGAHITEAHVGRRSGGGRGWCMMARLSHFNHIICITFIMYFIAILLPFSRLTAAATGAVMSAVMTALMGLMSAWRTPPHSAKIPKEVKKNVCQYSVNTWCIRGSQSRRLTPD